ncbi:NUDIX domain-containing protein [Hypoxylon rubiginosum]|uniref:NUDIX domain-containing protein n=1 Tax=Hypoxylon rubiginosum TaxID=110542 RepID=A0ACC0CKR6_9PEZI|nr:NUDIX domain-containing protein [Hypoxylon rubiginosum]
MAASRWKSTLYASEKFVEACGAVVFDTSSDPKRVLLLYDSGCDEWVLPKGRRNCNESRKAAAVREVREESGCAIQLLPTTMSTRAPSDWEAANVKDEPRSYDSLTEPFMLDVRDLGNAKGVKLVWWFIAELGGVQGDGEAQFRPEFIQCDQATEQLTFQKDRDVLIKALEIMERSTTENA